MAQPAPDPILNAMVPVVKHAEGATHGSSHPAVGDTHESTSSTTGDTIIPSLITKISGNPKPKQKPDQKTSSAIDESKSSKSLDKGKASASKGKDTKPADEVEVEELTDFDLSDDVINEDPDDGDEKAAVNPSEIGVSEGKKGKKRVVYASDEAEDSGLSTANPHVHTGGSAKKKQVTGVAKKPTGLMLKYNTMHYKLYNPKLKNVGEHVYTPHAKFSDYDTYSLFMIPDIKSVDEVPERGVRLDDFTVAFVSEKRNKKTLTANWQAEFDQDGMVRGPRIPLGHAAKLHRKEGDRDIYGNVLTKAEEGYYYLWYWGLHNLCGKEGFDAGVYLKRPSHEIPPSTGLTWRKDSRAVVQLPPGHKDDPTFRDVPGYHSQVHGLAKLPDDKSKAYIRASKAGKPTSKSTKSDVSELELATISEAQIESSKSG